MFQNSLASMLESWFIPIKGHIRNFLPILILWYIWKARNEAKHDNIKMDPTLIINNIKRKVFQLFNLNVISSKTFAKHAILAGAFYIHLDTTLINIRESFVYWIKPKLHYVKLNTDGPVDREKARAGGLIRDFGGEILAAFAAPVIKRNVIFVELQALHFGLDLCLKKGFNNVWIEVDSLFFLVQNVGKGNGCADWLAKKGSLMEDYEELDILNIYPILKGMLLMDKCWVSGCVSCIGFLICGGGFTFLCPCDGWLSD
ncbi:uncharacterized protein LOC110093615, partial [Dendrobium catenatum]|uniref:uncharacterized protein LOC110093615 n=1 Tax=Dendrobium catenatum TaxID=906689 RepID=UPI0009F58432